MIFTGALSFCEYWMVVALGLVGVLTAKPLQRSGVFVAEDGIR
jgi:hypothetical protein